MRIDLIGILGHWDISFKGCPDVPRIPKGFGTFLGTHWDMSRAMSRTMSQHEERADD